MEVDSKHALRRSALLHDRNTRQTNSALVRHASVPLSLPERALSLVVVFVAHAVFVDQGRILQSAST